MENYTREMFDKDCQEMIEAYAEKHQLNRQPGSDKIDDQDIVNAAVALQNIIDYARTHDDNFMLT